MALVDELKKDIGIGLDIECFLDGAAGKAFFALIDDQTELAINALIAADPEDPKAIRKLQNTITRNREFRGGLLELVQIGENAEAQLNNPDESEG